MMQHTKHRFWYSSIFEGFLALQNLNFGVFVTQIKHFETWKQAKKQRYFEKATISKNETPHTGLKSSNSNIAYPFVVPSRVSMSRLVFESIHRKQMFLREIVPLLTLNMILGHALEPILFIKNKKVTRIPRILIPLLFF